MSLVESRALWAPAPKLHIAWILRQVISSGVRNIRIKKVSTLKFCRDDLYCAPTQGIILMRVLVAICFFVLSLSAFARSEENYQNKEYAAIAVNAAKAIHDFNWGSFGDEVYEVINERIRDRGEGGVAGTYKVRLFIKNPATGEISDGGKDFVVYIYGNSVLKIQIDCRLCG